MPIYEYSCEKCREMSEIIQKFGEATPDECPSCGAAGSLKRVVSSSAFHLKGGGWYKDLYASKKTEDRSSKIAPKKSGENKNVGKDDSTKKATKKSGD